MYQLLKQEGRARRGTFTTVDGAFQTPAFMLFRSKSSVKSAMASPLDWNSIAVKGRPAAA